MTQPARRESPGDDRLLPLSPREAVAEMAAARDELELGKLAAAGMRLREVVSRLPQLAHARALLADVHYRRREWRQAAFQAREAIRLDPEIGFRAREIVGNCEQQLGNLLADPENEGLLWHVGRELSRYPDRKADYADLAQLVEKFVLPGFLPPSRPFHGGSRLLTLGSCFATELRLHLAARGVAESGLWVPEGLNNTFALRQFIQWCVSGAPSDDAYWYDAAEDGLGRKWTPAAEQADYRRRFEAADGFVITVGLAEVWRDKLSGGVFWRGVPKSIYEPGRYECRMSTVEENEANLRAIVAELGSLGGGKPIVFTLSPIPLKATFRQASCVAMDCVSKSILRVALANALQDAPPHVHYWPSFEIVKWLGCHLPQPMFGVEAMDERHLSRFVAPLIVDRFMSHYFADAEGAP